VRDIVLTLLVAGILPFTLKKPHYGLLLWIWLGIMNPHRLTYGFAYNLPFAQISAIFFFLGILFNLKQTYRFPWNGITVTMLAFVLWIGVSPWFSFHPEFEFEFWVRVFKIQLMVLVGFLVIGNRQQLNAVIAVLALSVGFYGIKGGIFTILTGGGNRVWGPDFTFIADNNTLALAVVMIVPLFRYLQLEMENKWIKWGCIAAMLLCIASALGSHSRGAFLAIVAMSIFLWLKSPKKLGLGIAMAIAVAMFLPFLPEEWYARMSTIQTYDQDASAGGRINAWWVAWNVAVDRFPIGAGFKMYMADVFAMYAPNPLDIHAAHSIYFQVLGEHGFFGLFLFLTIFVLAWRYGSYIIRETRNQPELTWARNLAAMTQVSLVGYAIGGAFLSLSYFDLPYYLVLVLVVLKGIIRDETLRRTAESNAAKPDMNLQTPTAQYKLR
jgi:probable O-glycosylation ligase (exosortase A-associated)